MLKKQIQEDAVKALKEGSKEVAELLRMTLSVINSKEKEKRYKISLGHSKTLGHSPTGEPGEAKDNPSLNEEELGKQSELTEEEMINTISSEIKKRKDAIALYQQGNRPELAEKEQKEIDVIKKYLPEQLSLEELRKIIEESVSRVGAKEMKDPSKNPGQVMGKVMADLMPKIKGKADNSEVSKIIKELISK